MSQNDRKRGGGLGNSIWSTYDRRPRPTQTSSKPPTNGSAPVALSSSSYATGPGPAAYRTSYRPPPPPPPPPPSSDFSTAVSAAPLLRDSATNVPSTAHGQGTVSINGREFVPPSPTADPSESGMNKYVFAFQALKHFEQTCQRLGWKRIDLDASHKRTLDPAAWGFSDEHADQNFKIDFYEFYQLIERALVLIQRVWGIDIPRGGSGTHHNYHENVLRRLSSPEHPLRAYLGTGDGNVALWKAKELRNRWKDAATGKMGTHPLKMYDVSWIVKTILDCLQRAYVPSKVKMDEYFVQAMSEGDAEVMHTSETDNQPENWDWMTVDMDMDWE